MENGKGRRFTPETLMATMALVISISALGVSVFEARILDAQQRASVWPYVDVGLGYNDEGYRLVAENNGIGPARITGVELRINGEAKKDWLDAVDSIMGPGSGIDYSVIKSSEINRTVMSPQAQVLMFELPWTPKTRELLETVQNAELTVCYCSVFDTCWVTTLAQAGQERACPIEPDNQFKG